MTRTAQTVFMTEIYPIIIACIGRVKPVGCEDAEELAQDSLVSAAQMLDSAEKSGKPIFPRSIAYYSLQRTKTGRRSTSAGKTDAMSSATIMAGRSSVDSLDDPVTGECEDGEFTIGDMLAASQEDPATLVARDLDWSEFNAGLDDADKDVLLHTAEGWSGTELAQELRVSCPRISQRKREIGLKLKERWGNNILGQIQEQPLWAATLQVVKERHACRYNAGKQKGTENKS